MPGATRSASMRPRTTAITARLPGRRRPRAASEHRPPRRGAAVSVPDRLPCGVRVVRPGSTVRFARRSAPRGRTSVPVVRYVLYRLSRRPLAAGRHAGRDGRRLRRGPLAVTFRAAAPGMFGRWPCRPRSTPTAPGARSPLRQPLKRWLIATSADLDADHAQHRDPEQDRVEHDHQPDGTPCQHVADPAVARGGPSGRGRSRAGP